MEKVKRYIKEHKNKLPSYDMEKNICYAVSDLCACGEIELFNGEKETESDFMTDGISWTEFEERTAEEILEGITT